ncbi:LysE family translocator [Wenxinia marina]|uniref:Threonine efflux protein n=1 Tax=Wenxinia marina DSM 24838 TaxID=1123501 RepID=A0A0D0QBN7_9RHOB|nr:LysE family transporter [Wenxinia marina]KIQ68368.1 Putative threonine efflux protein [Wenxinia marina DSM 24838]GGL72743.1 homoserine/homoserine lactone efflux protein [Wenxinia marina]
MSWDTYALYLVTLGVFFATPPGTSQILIMTNSLRHGLRASLPTAAGDLTANSLQIMAAGFGLTALIGQSAEALTVVKWLGVAYLVWYGLRVWRSPPPDGLEGRADPSAPRRLFAQGFLTSAANPEAVFFFAALFPQFIDPAQALAPQIAILGATYIVVDGLILVLMGAASERLLGRLRSRGRLLNRLAGGAMIGAAALLGAKDVRAR